jgi:hypothetical protein
MSRPTKQENETLHRLCDLLVGFARARGRCKTAKERETLGALEWMVHKRIKLIEKEIAGRKTTKRKKEQKIGIVH